MNDTDDGESQHGQTMLAPSYADLRRRWRVIRRIHRELDYSRLRELELDTDLAEHESRIAGKRSPERWLATLGRAGPMICATVREQLAIGNWATTATNHATSRLLIAHLESCDGCREFAAEVRRQHADMAVMLQVEPSDELRSFLDEGGFRTAW